VRNRPAPNIGDKDRHLAQHLVIETDRDVLVLNKPPGLACEVRGQRGETTVDSLLWAFARSNGKRPHLVHRLDRETSGVLLAAHTKPAAKLLGAAFEAREVEKTYLAIVGVGGSIAETGTIDAPIARTTWNGRPSSRIGRAVDREAKAAVTRWEVLGQAGEHALLRVFPETGRMHQIRVHLAHLGCPIVGDDVYGGDTALATRTLLHARAIAYPHPAGDVRRVPAERPDDFTRTAAALGLAGALEAA